MSLPYGCAHDPYKHNHKAPRTKKKAGLAPALYLGEGKMRLKMVGTKNIITF